jgi:hypothetical protein
MFNTLKPIFIVSERAVKISDGCGNVIYFELFGRNVMKIITTGQIFLLNYELSRFSK